MNKEFFLIFSMLSLVLYSCGKENMKFDLFNDISSISSDDKDPSSLNNGKINVDPHFSPFIMRINEKLTGFGVAQASLKKMNFVSVKFGTLMGPKVGECSRGYSSNDYFKTKNYYFREITIDKMKWDKISDDSDYGRTAVLAHEYGHCAWFFEHLEQEHQIMSPILDDVNEDAWKYFAEQIKAIKN